MKRFRTKKVMTVVLAGAIVLGGAGAALAYFTSSGNGTGSGTVGTTTAWGVSSATTGGPLQPGVATSDETVAVTITNNSAGNQELNSFTIEVAGPGGSAYTSGTTNFPTEVACTSAEFALGTNAGAGSYTDSGIADDLTPGSSDTIDVNLALLDNSYAQDNCQGVTVPLYITAS